MTELTSENFDGVVLKMHAAVDGAKQLSLHPPCTEALSVLLATYSVPRRLFAFQCGVDLFRRRKSSCSPRH